MRSLVIMIIEDVGTLKSHKQHELVCRWSVCLFFFLDV